MNLPRLNDNLNIHQSLPDNPNLVAEDLKKKFDEAANIIKRFLNDLLIEDLEIEIPEEIEAKINTAVGNIQKEIEKIKTDFDTELQNYKKEIDQLIQNAVSKGTNYGDFILTTNNNQLLSTNEQYGESVKTPTFTKEGYKPLAMVGWTTTNKAWNISEVYTQKMTESSVTIYIRGNSIPNHGNIYDSTTVSVHILWIKVKK